MVVYWQVRTPPVAAEDTAVDVVSDVAVVSDAEMVYAAGMVDAVEIEGYIDYGYADDYADSIAIGCGMFSIIAPDHLLIASSDNYWIIGLSWL